MVDGRLNAVWDGGGAAGAFAEIDVALFDGVEEHREILVARHSGEATGDPFQTAAAAAEGPRRRALNVCVRNLGRGAPGFSGSPSQVDELQLGVGL